MKEEPLKPEIIYIFLYVKDQLSLLEKKIFYFKWIDKYKYTEEDLKRTFGLSKDMLEKVISHINKIIKEQISNTKIYKDFKSRCIKEFGNHIYEIKLIDKEKRIAYHPLKSKYLYFTLEEIKNTFKENYQNLTQQEKNIIDKYYRKRTPEPFSPSYINRKINAEIFGNRYSLKNIKTEKLYNTFINNKKYFSEEQIRILESYFFPSNPNEKFLKNCPTREWLKTKNVLMDRLEKMYYGIYRILENDFDEKEYLLVKKTDKEKLGQKRIEILDNYYGINQEKKSVQELAVMYHTTYEKMLSSLRDAKEFAMNLYTNRNKTIKIDPSLYRKYIEDPRFQFTEEARNLLKLFILEKKSYEEIKKITNLSLTKISNVITENVKRMDSYRFQLLLFEDYTKEMLEEFYSKSNEKFEKIEKQIIENKYIFGMENKDNALKVNIPLSKVNRIVARFKETYFSYKIKDVVINQEDIKEEFMCSSIESVLSPKEKEILSYSFGIITDYNKEGLHLKPSEIYKKLNINKNIYQYNFSFGIRKLKGKKIGIFRPELLYIEKKELMEILKDPHLPITPKERDIIYHLFGIYGFKTQTLEELSENYEESVSNIKRGYMRSILDILKYKNGEIEGIINYEIDVLPNLRYFPLSYRPLMEDYYKENKTYKDLSEKYNFTKNQITCIFDQIKMKLFDRIHHPEKPSFDFQFYEENRYNKFLPFYGDQTLTDQMFRLYFGIDTMKRKSIPEIRKELNVPFETIVINKMLSNYMLSFCRLKDGIQKIETFSYEEIKEYYKIHEQTMKSSLKKSFEKYFRRIKNQKFIYTQRNSIPERILYSMIKEKNKNCFDVNKVSRTEVLEILKKYNKKIPSKIKNHLMSLFNITGKEFMTGREKNHLYRILNKLDNQLSLEEQKQYIHHL